MIWSKRALSDCVLCIPFIFSGSPDEVPNIRNSNLEISIGAPLVARNNHTQSAPEGSETFICYR